MTRVLLQLLGGALVGGLGAALVAGVIDLPKMTLDAVHLAVLVAGMPLAVFLGIAIHELGHIATGLMAGFRPWLLVVGPLKLQRDRQGYRWRSERNRSFPIHGGFAGCTPVGLHSLRQRMTVLLAGGALANLLTIVVVAVVLANVDFPRVNGRLPGWPGALYLWAVFLALISMLMAGIALAPSSGHGFYSDGARILRFLKGGREADAEVAVLAIVAATTCGQRPREWPGELITQALELPVEASGGVAARSLAFMRALDRGEIDEARGCLRVVMEGRDRLPLVSQASVSYMAAQFAALHDGDAVGAREHFEAGRKLPDITAYKQPFVEALVRWREGTPDVGALLDAAEREMPKSIDPGSAEVDRDVIAWLRGEIAAGRPAPP